MPQNIFRKTALEEKKKGDKLESKQVQIFRLPTKALLIASLASATGGIIWACVAKIPIDYSGTAVVLSVDNQMDVMAGGPGRFVLTRSKTLNKYKDILDLAWKIQTNPDLQIEPKKLAVLAESMLNITNFTNFERFIEELPTGIALRDIASSRIPAKTGYPVGIIFSDDARQSFVESLKKNFEDLADAESRITRSTALIDNYQTLLAGQKKILESYKRLENKNYVSKVSFLEQKSIATNYISQIAQSKSTLEQAETDNIIALKSLMIAMQEYIVKSFVTSEADGYIANLSVGQGSVVAEGSEILSISTREQRDHLPPIIAGLVGTKASNHLNEGDRVIATPVGVNKAEYGGMIGRMKTLVPFGENSATLSKILGTSTIASQTVEGMSSTPNLILIEMDRDEEKDDYIWTSKNVPTRPTNLGDVLSISITAERKTPLQLVIPIIKEAMGLEGPTTFKGGDKK